MPLATDRVRRNGLNCKANVFQVLAFLFPNCAGTNHETVWIDVLLSYLTRVCWLLRLKLPQPPKYFWICGNTSAIGWSRIASPITRTRNGLRRHWSRSWRKILITRQLAWWTRNPTSWISWEMRRNLLVWEIWSFNVFRRAELIYSSSTLVALRVTSELISCLVWFLPFFCFSWHDCYFCSLFCYFYFRWTSWFVKCLVLYSQIPSFTWRNFTHNLNLNCGVIRFAIITTYSVLT